MAISRLRLADEAALPVLAIFDFAIGGLVLCDLQLLRRRGDFSVRAPCRRFNGQGPTQVIGFTKPELAETFEAKVLAELRKGYPSLFLGSDGARPGAARLQK